MTGQRQCFVGVGLLALALLMLSACSGQLWNLPGPEGGYVRLNIGYSASRAINVTEREVTGLAVELYDPADGLVGTVAWEADEGAKSYLIPVSQEGTYRIEVTHISAIEGTEVAQIKEQASFDIQAMVITVIDITPGCIGAINVAGPAQQTQMPDGTLTVNLTGSWVADGTTLAIGVFPTGVDMSDWLAVIVAHGGGDFVGGSVSSPTIAWSTGNTWIGTGGSFYDVYVWVDMNDNMDVYPYAEPGIDLRLSTFPVAVQINGDTMLDLQGSELISVQ